MKEGRKEELYVCECRRPESNTADVIKRIVPSQSVNVCLGAKHIRAAS